MTIDQKLLQPNDEVDYQRLSELIKQYGKKLGFQQIGISDIDLNSAADRLQQWLANHYHGEMEFMARNTELRRHPDQLLPDTLTIISARMDYLTPVMNAGEVMQNPQLGFISRYALGRDYHKLLRKRLQKLADYVGEITGKFGYRVFTDSAPVLEKAIAEKAGLGWIGKHSNLLSREAGSWFFLGEIFTTLPLPTDQPVSKHCGNCSACIDICPTRAIVAPYEVDARRCISYLTIELRGSIPVELRPLLGNRIYGCDDCQLVCPWNRFATFSQEQDFLPRHGLDAPQLLALFNWSETMFMQRLEGSPIRRIGHECWLRNIAVALGNGPKTTEVISALQEKLHHTSELVREHTQWALERLTQR